jgi:putative flippase GtrA
LRDAFQRRSHMPKLNAKRLRLSGEIIRFGVVGVAGFVVDAGVLTLALLAGAGPWLGRVISYVAAATATFALNRGWTFRHADRSRPVTRDWGLFLAVNLVGFACNYGTYAALISGVPMMRDLPILAVAAGSLAGMVGNFVLSRRYVFRSRYDGAASVVE